MPVSSAPEVRLALIASIVWTVGCSGVGDVQERPLLRVGTTGDSPPFSMSMPTGYAGADIDLARDLGESLGRSVEFVATSWRSLESDIAAARFDLAMSGISITQRRLRVADFSTAYSSQYRVVVVRCADAHRFVSPEQLDQSGNMIAVPEGGAGVEYVRQHFGRATIVEESRMDGAYRRLARGEGTAIIETPFRYRHYDGLCLGLAGQRFFSTPVGVMLPERSPLADEVDRWVRRRLADGTVALVLEHYQP